jgi:hypothetical protein
VPSAVTPSLGNSAISGAAKSSVSVTAPSASQSGAAANQRRMGGIDTMLSILACFVFAQVI